MTSHQLSIAQSVLATTLTLVSFIFTILSLTTSAWSSSAQYTSPSTPPRISNRVLKGSSYRGPYRDCPLLQNATTLKWSNVCFDGTCFDSDASQFGGHWWCQQLELGAKLLLAGSVFTGIGFLSCAVDVLLALTVGAKRHKGRHRPLDARKVFASWEWFTNLMLVTAVGTWVLGWAIAANLLVNQQKLDGDFISSLTVPVLSDHWIMGKGIAYGAAAWVPTLFAIACLPPQSWFGLRRRHSEEHIIVSEARMEQVSP